MREEGALTVAEAVSKESERASVTTRVLTSLVALCLCGVLAWALNRGSFGAEVAGLKTSYFVALSIIVALATVLPWLDQRHHSRVFLGGSLLVGTALIKWLLAFPVLVAWLTLRVARAEWRVWRKLTLLFAVWLAGVFAKWSLPREYYLPLGLVMYWVALPPAMIWLVVERARGRLKDVTARDEWAYLMGAPRFFLPVMQPIGVRSFVQARQPQTLRLALSALGLGVYGLSLVIAARQLQPRIRSLHEDLLHAYQIPSLLENLALTYCINAAGIFLAVSLYRILGYGLGSGYRYPFLATSFADLFRRWNYYYYEYVTTIFYLPLAARLRRWMPLGLAYVLAGYPSIFLGVWVLNNVTGQLATSRSFGPMLHAVGNWQRLLAYAAVWSLIIIPQVVFARFRRFRKYLLWRLASWLLTLATVFGVLAALYYLRLVVF